MLVLGNGALRDPERAPNDILRSLIRALRIHNVLPNESGYYDMSISKADEQALLADTSIVNIFQYERPSGEVWKTAAPIVDGAQFFTRDENDPMDVVK